MKLKLLAAIILGLPALAFSQVSLNVSMAPAVGSRFIYFDANVPSPAFTFSKSGTSNTWDFNSITPVAGADDTTFVVSPSSVIHGSNFPAATHCSYDDGANPSYTMLQINSSGVTYLGIVADLTASGNYLPLVITPPLQAMVFPYTYGSGGTGTGTVFITVSGAMVNQPTMDSVRFKSTNTGQRNVIASGNMILPSGTMAAMLERNINTKQDSAWVKGTPTAGQWILASSSTVIDSSFRWYTNNSLQPYAHALYDNTGLHDVHYFKAMVTGIDEPASSFAGSVYPNPVSNTLYLGIPSNFQSHFMLKIFNSQGQLVVNGSASQNQLDVSFLQPGIYFVNLMDEEGKTGTAKFIKN